MPTAPTPPAKNDAIGSKAAAAIESTVSVGDPPSELNDDVEMDYDFAKYDPTDIAPHLKKHKVEIDLETYSVCWVERDVRVWDRYIALGFVPVAGGKIVRGTTVLCQMPKKRRDAFLARGAEKARMLLNAPMSRFDDEVDKYKTQGFSPFDGSRNARDGLD